jgi:hypothetical protein
VLGRVGAKRVELAENERRVVGFERERWAHGSFLRCRIEPHIGLAVGGVGFTFEDLSPVLVQTRDLSVGAEDLGVFPP